VSVAIAATASTAAAAAAAATTPTRRTFLTRPRFVNSQGAALEIFLVEHVDGLGRVFLGPHLDERKAPRATGGTVLHNVDCNHRARLGKVILQVVFGCGER
jgi:hypothetical protein